MIVDVTAAPLRCMELSAAEYCDAIGQEKSPQKPQMFNNYDESVECRRNEEWGISDVGVKKQQLKSFDVEIHWVIWSPIAKQHQQMQHQM